MPLCMEGNVQSGRTQLLNACVPGHCKNTGSVGTSGWDRAIAFIYPTLSHCRKRCLLLCQLWHSHFSQHGSLPWEKAVLLQHLPTQHFWNKVVCSCHGSEETLLTLSLVSIEDLLPHDTGSKWRRSTHCLHNCTGSVCDIQKNPRTTPNRLAAEVSGNNDLCSFANL